MRKLLIVLLLVSCCSAQTLISGRRRTLQAGGGPPPPAAGLSYVTSCTGTTSCTPSGTIAGDLYVIAVGRDLSITAPTNPSTPQTSTAIGTAQTINGTSTADSYFQIFCKVAAGTDEATGTWTSASGIAVTVYRNTLATTTAGCATDAFGTPSKNTTAINTTTTTVTYNSITNGSAASWDLGFAYAPGATVGLGTAPTSMTNRALQGSTKIAAHDTNGSVSSWTTANVTVTTAGRVMTTTVELNAPVAATPSLTPSSGTPPQSVTLASATTGADAYIHYTTTGVDPTSGDTTGTSVAVSVDPTTVKAKVISMPGWTDSAVSSGTYASGGGTSNSFTGGANKNACFSVASGTSCAAGITSTTGRLLVVGFITQDGTSTLSCSDSVNGAWTTAGSVFRGTGTAVGFSWQHFYVIASGSGAATLTCSTTGTNGFHSWSEGDFSATGTITLDGTPANNQFTASGTTATLSGLTTLQSNGLLIASCLFAQTTCALGTGFTSDDNGFNGATSGLVEYKLNLASSGAQTGTFVTGGSGDVIGGGLVAFKAN